MANHVQEFLEYVNFIKKKLLRNTISQYYATNYVKLGVLLNHTKINKPEIEKSLLTFHKACKKSKLSMLENKHLIGFRLKISKISKKLLYDMKTDDFKSGKIRKLCFTKKNSKLIPNHVQRLISDISLYIGETVNETDINVISDNMFNETLNLKRKRFSRQVKESLLKYFNDFSNLIELKNELPQLENVTADTNELNSCLEKLDLTITKLCLTKSLTDIETFINSEVTEIPPFIPRSAMLLINNTEITEDNYNTTQMDDVDFNDFNVVEEWDEDGDIYSDRPENDSTNDLLDSMEQINSIILDNITTNMRSYESNKILTEILGASESVDFTGYLNVSCDNHTISNLQQSYFLDFNGEINKIIDKIKSTNRSNEIKKEDDDDLLRNRNLYIKPKASIKILNLKKPNAYLSQDNDKESKSNELFLENIPLPTNLPNKSSSNNSSSRCSVNKDDPLDLMTDQKTVVDEESDNADEELIPQSILDFSEVLIDEFDGKENLELPDMVCKLTDPISQDEYQTESRCIFMKPEFLITQSVDLDNVASSELNEVAESRGENKFLEETSSRVHNVTNVRYKKTQSTVYKSNYSIFSIDADYSNTDFHSTFYNNREDGDYVCFDDDEEETDDGNYLNYSRNQNQYNNFYYNSNYRNYERGNRRLFRNFLHYTSQSNGADRRWYNETNRFNNQLN